MCVLTDGTVPRLTTAGSPETRMAYVPKGSYTGGNSLVSYSTARPGLHGGAEESVFLP